MFSHKAMDVRRIHITTPSPAIQSWNRHQHQGDARATTAPTWWQTTAPANVYHSNQQRDIQQPTQTNVHYRPLIEPQIRTTPSYYYHYTTAAPRWDQNGRNVQVGPNQNSNGANTQLSERRQPAEDQRNPPNNRWNLRETQQQ
ncbi:unnamed protein product, partial [Strongylus vulgaris]